MKGLKEGFFFSKEQKETLVYLLRKERNATSTLMMGASNKDKNTLCKERIYLTEILKKLQGDR